MTSIITARSNHPSLNGNASAGATFTVLRKLDQDYDPTHRGKAFNYLRAKLREGEHVTGLIYVASGGPDMHAMAATSEQPLNAVPYEKLHPGAAGLAKVLKRYA